MNLWGNLGQEKYSCLW